METIVFDAGRPAFPAAPSDCVRYYHGSSVLFSPTIEQDGFAMSHQFFSINEVLVLEKYAAYMPRYGTSVWRLHEPIRITLTRHFDLALTHAVGQRKGGIARGVAEDTTDLLNDVARELPAEDRAILEAIQGRYRDIATSSGAVYAVDLEGPCCDRLCTPKSDPTYVPFDIPPDRITYKTVVPVDFQPRLL